MKKKFTFYRFYWLIVMVLMSFALQLKAQAPQLLNYQGVARNAVGNPLPNQNMTLRISIRKNSASGMVEYAETRTTTTNGWGLFAVQIGSAGTQSTIGTMAGINWMDGTKFMEIEMDPTGGNNFINLGATQLLSVPYALNAASAATAAPIGAAGGDLKGTYPNPIIVKDAITTIKLADLAVSTIKLSDQAVTTTKIADGAITTSKIADSSVTNDKIVSVSASKITGTINLSAKNLSDVVAISNGGTGATTLAGIKNNLLLDKVENTADADKPISTASFAALNNKLNIADSATMLTNYARKQLLNDSLTAVRTNINSNTTSIATKINIADSAAMLTNYARKKLLNDSLAAVRTAINANTASIATKVNIADSAAMLANYARKQLLNDSLTVVRTSINSNTASIATKINIADSAAMLTNYARKQLLNDSLAALRIGINSNTASIATKINIADSAAMLTNYARKQLLNDSLAAVRTTINLNTSSIATKINIADTAAMLTNYARKQLLNDSLAALRIGINSNTASIATKINIADSAAMLTNYARKQLLNDSLAAVRDNINLNTASIATKLNITDSAAMLTNYARKQLMNDSLAAVRTNINSNTSSIATKINIADSAAMLTNYARKQLMNDSLAAVRTNINSNTASIATKINIADTASMLAGYLALTGGTVNGGISVRSVTADSIKKSGGTSNQYLMADGSVSAGAAPVREVADEFTATAAQTAFTLTQTPSANSKLKMFINGIRISNTTYSFSGTTVTYSAANNGNYTLSVGDRIQFDYYY